MNVGRTLAAIAVIGAWLFAVPSPASADISDDCINRWYTFQAGDGLRLQVPFNGGFYGGEVSADARPSDEWQGTQYFLVCKLIFNGRFTGLNRLYSNTTKQWLHYNNLPPENGDFIWALGTPQFETSSFIICDYNGDFLQIRIPDLLPNGVRWVYADAALQRTPLRATNVEFGATLFRSNPRLNDIVPNCPPPG